MPFLPSCPKPFSAVAAWGAGSVRLHSLGRYPSSCREYNARRMCIRRNRSWHPVNQEAMPLRNARNYSSFPTSLFSKCLPNLCFQKLAVATSSQARSLCGRQFSLRVANGRKIDLPSRQFCDCQSHNNQHRSYKSEMVRADGIDTQGSDHSSDRYAKIGTRSVQPEHNRRGLGS
jgi:hypothetical protein